MAKTQPGRLSVGIIGAGSFGTAIGNVLARDIANKPMFHSTITMWMYDEEIDDGGTRTMLSTYVQHRHENRKYLPGVRLPDNLAVVTDLHAVASTCDILVFVVPHQFVSRIVQQLKDMVLGGKVACTLIKGMMFSEETAEIVLISAYIEEQLGWPCAAIMGANIAREMHTGVCEMTIGTRNDGSVLRALFTTPHVRASVVRDRSSVELFGALKNVVAIGYGIVRGLGLSINTQVSVMRRGMLEMVRLVRLVDGEADAQTLLESCGMPDLMVSCISGRNAMCGEEMARDGHTVEEVEGRMGGQKLQGTLCSCEVAMFLEKRGKTEEFPLFMAVYNVCTGRMGCERIVDVLTK